MCVTIPVYNSALTAQRLAWLFFRLFWLTVVLLSLFLLGKHGAECWGGPSQCVSLDKFSLPVLCCPLSLSVFLCVRGPLLCLCVLKAVQQPRAQPFGLCLFCVFFFFPCMLQEPLLRQLRQYVMLHPGLAHFSAWLHLCVYVCVGIGDRFFFFIIYFWDCTSMSWVWHVQMFPVFCIDHGLQFYGMRAFCSTSCSTIEERLSAVQVKEIYL